MAKINRNINNLVYEGDLKLKLPVQGSSILFTSPMVFDITPGNNEKVHVYEENSESIILIVGASRTSDIKAGCLVFSLI